MVSSDFCHWGERFDYCPCDKTSAIHEYIERLDKDGIEAIVSHDRKRFEGYLKETKNTICGRYPITLLMAIIEEAKQQGADLESKLAQYDQSSQVTTPDDSSVSYASIFTVMK